MENPQTKINDGIENLNSIKCYNFLYDATNLLHVFKTTNTVSYVHTLNYHDITHFWIDIYFNHLTLIHLTHHMGCWYVGGRRGLDIGVQLYDLIILSANRKLRNKLATSKSCLNSFWNNSGKKKLVLFT
jgi:hypothetical protein